MAALAGAALVVLVGCGGGPDASGPGGDQKITLGGSGGIGRLLLNSVSAVDPTLTFSVVIFLSVVGIALVVGSDYIRGRVLHWW